MSATGLLTLVHVMTLSIWSLPEQGFRIQSPFRTERVSAICEELRGAATSTDGWDIVLIQDAQVSEDRETLKSCGYAHSAIPEADANSGLLILSRYPLEKVSTWSSPGTSGGPVATGMIAKANLGRSASGFTWVANAQFNTRVAEDIRSLSFSNFIKWASQTSGKDPLILGGSLGFTQESATFKALPQLLPAFTQAKILPDACTVCPPNIMHSKNEGKPDHLFASPHFSAQTGAVVMRKALRLTQDPLEVHLSDHFGWETTFARP